MTEIGIPGFALRAATNADAPAITELVYSVLATYRLSPDPKSTDVDLSDIERFYHQKGGSFCVLLNAAQKIIGTVGLHRISDAECELRKMYLHPDYRGRGLGKALLQHALAEARNRAFQKVVLETASVLKEALQLYSSFGFQPVTTDHLSCRCDMAMELRLRS